MTIVLGRIAMRTMKLVVLITLGLSTLAGPVSYVATLWIDSPETSHGSLFAIAWAFSFIGIIIGITFASIMPHTTSSDWRPSDFYGVFVTILVAIAFVFGFLGGIVYGMASEPGYGGDNSWDTPVYVTFLLATLSGFAISFLVTFLCLAYDSQTGSQVQTNDQEVPDNVRRIG